MIINGIRNFETVEYADVKIGMMTNFENDSTVFVYIYYSQEKYFVELDIDRMRN